MSKSTRWLIGLALFGSAVSLLWLAAFDWAAWACRLPVGETGKPLAPGPAGCAEYWINRYQAFITGILALGAAAATVFINNKQVRLAQKSIAQSQISSMRSAYRQIAEARSLIDNFDNEIQDFVKIFDDIDDRYLIASNEYVDKSVTEASRNLVAFANKVLGAIRIGEAGPDANAAASKFLASCQAAAEYRDVFADCFPHFSFAREAIRNHRHNIEFEGAVLNSEEWRRLRDLIASARGEGMALRQDAKALRDALNHELARQRQMIEATEQQARV